MRRFLFLCIVMTCSETAAEGWGEGAVIVIWHQSVRSSLHHWHHLPWWRQSLMVSSSHEYSVNGIDLRFRGGIYVIKRFLTNSYTEVQLQFLPLCILDKNLLRYSLINCISDWYAIIPIFGFLKKKITPSLSIATNWETVRNSEKR